MFLSQEHPLSTMFIKQKVLGRVGVKGGIPSGTQTLNDSPSSWVDFQGRFILGSLMAQSSLLGSTSLCTGTSFTYRQLPRLFKVHAPEAGSAPYENSELFFFKPNPT